MSTKILTPEVRLALQRARVQGNRLELVDELDRKLYVAVAKAIEMMGGKWSRRERAHVFEDDAEDVVADALATGSVVDIKKLYQFFETPVAIARQLVETAGVQPGMHVLEPSAGGGRIVREILAVGGIPFICEVQAELARSLLKGDLRIRWFGTDFLAIGYGEIIGITFPAIIANPPFARGADVDHVTHMLRFLGPGGRLVSVMSPAWTFRETEKHRTFRDTVGSMKSSWNELPAGSFRESGTDVTAGILVLDRA